MIHLPGTKVHTVLATLVLAEGRTVSDEHLCDMLWSWDPPATMNAQIYTYISRLRKRLGNEVELIRRPRGYQLHTQHASLDLAEFEKLARTGRSFLGQELHEEASRDLGAALKRFSGPALTNVTEFLADAERPRLEELRLGVTEDWIEAELALGRHQALVPDLTALTQNHPMRERLRAQLMTALYRCDRQVDALEVYRAGREVLAEELGIDPGAALSSVHQGVLDGSLSQPASVARAAAQPAARPAPAMLPPDVANFTGRRTELDLLRQRPRPGEETLPRRWFITGMPGVGKTALAVHAAHAVRDRYPDGQLYADLTENDGGAKDPAEVLTGFLRALGVAPPAGGPSVDELVRLYRTHIAGRRILVLLDNAVGDRQLAPLMPNSAESAVVVTSRRHPAEASGRETLNLVPFGNEEAVEYLAAIAGPDRIHADPEAALSIVACCAALPLALRIAGLRLAARPRWSAAALAERLADPCTRLDELAFGDLSVQQALISALGQASPRGRHALPELSVFDDRAFHAEAAAVELHTSRNSAERTLEELVEVGLLEPEGTDLPGYRLNELVRPLAAGLAVRPAAGRSAARTITVRGPVIPQQAAGQVADRWIYGPYRRPDEAATATAAYVVGQPVSVDAHIRRDLWR
ncbi:BTAD domain-containing putative transcriptional regulator [Streptomyces sp. NPDC041003]|uniref:AfsR/SARP family transcriptional regulator n=1 Tax=Streptomyces sp. NPDC041003 TaxID=3155730 RepID=UPI0033F71F55